MYKSKSIIISIFIMIFISLFTFSVDNLAYPILPILNIIPGLGIGSFIDGDIDTGLASALGELTGIALMVTPDILFDNNIISWENLYPYGDLLQSSGFGLYTLCKFYSIGNSIGHHYGYESDITQLLYTLPGFGIGAFLNKDIIGGLILLVINSYSVYQLYKGISEKIDQNFYYAVIANIIAGAYGTARYYDFKYNLNLSFPIVFNIFPGFGLGSFIQGDFVTGALCGTADLIGR